MSATPNRARLWRKPRMTRGRKAEWFERAFCYLQEIAMTETVTPPAEPEPEEKVAEA